MYRAVERYPDWRSKHQWLLRGAELMEVFGKEEFQWFFTKFNTVTGFVKPFFEVEAPEHEYKG